MLFSSLSWWLFIVCDVTGDGNWNDPTAANNVGSSSSDVVSVNETDKVVAVEVVEFINDCEFSRDFWLSRHFS